MTTLTTPSPDNCPIQVDLLDLRKLSRQFRRLIRRSHRHLHDACPSCTADPETCFIAAAIKPAIRQALEELEDELSL